MPQGMGGICFELRLPEGLAGLRIRGVSASPMAIPEAPMHEYHRLQPRQDEIWGPGQIRDVEWKTIASPCTIDRTSNSGGVPLPRIPDLTSERFHLGSESPRPPRLKSTASTGYPLATARQPCRLESRDINKQNYEVNQNPVSSILTWVQDGEIAIPEIQRPFVWDRTKVRDLLDSLYRGYPVGYLISWRNPDVRLKDGSNASGKRVLIDGQQRVTALRAALIGDEVIGEDYRKRRIKIGFHPVDEIFEVNNPAIDKDSSWIPDIAGIVGASGDIFQAVENYLTANPSAERSVVQTSLLALSNIAQRPIGMIELGADLDIEVVTEIFIRINSQGVKLSQADFAMSKLGSDDSFGGQTLRKAIDYFCHMAVAPHFHAVVRENDPEFAKTDWWQRIDWLKDEKDDLYDPDFGDVLRVAFTSQFSRGRLRDLVALLSGRNFEAKTYEVEIAEASFNRLSEGVERYVNKKNFNTYLMVLRSAGLVVREQLRSASTVNFGYMLYLHLRRVDERPHHEIESLVRRWVVMSTLLRRYSGSSESAIDYDIRAIEGRGVEAVLADIEEERLADNYWNAALPRDLETANMSHRLAQLLWAAQVKDKDLGFLGGHIAVQDLMQHHGDKHHIFPQAFMKKRGFTPSQYNQIANLAMTQQEINIRIGKIPPANYIERIESEAAAGKPELGSIEESATFHRNMRQHCIPLDRGLLAPDRYMDFLDARRHLMAAKLRSYYEAL